MGILDDVADLAKKVRDFNPIEEIWGHWTQVASSNIKAYRYNEGTRVLQIMFNAGSRIYGFKDVPKNIVDEFASADSKGKFFNSAIKHSYTAE